MSTPERVSEILQTPLTICEAYLSTDDSTFTIDSPGEYSLSGMILRKDGPQQAIIDELFVAEHFRSKGIGRHVVKNFFQYCVFTGIDVVDSSIINSQAFRIRARLLGEDANHIIGYIDDDEVELPISVDQACASLQRTQQSNPMDYIDEHGDFWIRDGFYVKVYIREIEDRVRSWGNPNFRVFTQQFVQDLGYRPDHESVGLA